MPSLDFKGKQFVYAHHLTVPFRQLNVVDKKSLPAKGNKPSLDDNLIIHGDNLHALKALLPKYAGKVKCIYIDPPYNTGNEGWCYNDKVNSPLMKEWLKNSASHVDKEDLERHDKWLCMMWPRLQLLRELLAEDGSIWISIDDNESHYFKVICDEIFGRDCFMGDIAYRTTDNSNNNAMKFSQDHNNLIVFSKTPDWVPKFLNEPDKRKHFKNPNDDPNGLWFDGNPVNNPALRPNLQFNITSPQGVIIKHPPNGWRWSEDTIKNKLKTGELRFSEDGTRLIRRTYLNDMEGLPPSTLWIDLDTTGHNRQAKYELKKIFPDEIVTDLFSTPKPTKLIKQILHLATSSNDIILDSFAGSGTTAHAVLALNNEDGGNRKFILVECEDYADKITAERVLRVIKGVTSAKDESLRTGLGGHFTFCELGNEINIENLLKGENLPSYEELARYAFYTATGQTLEKVKQGADYFVGETNNYRVHVIYKPDVEFLRSHDSALNMPMAERIAESVKGTGKTALVFATHKFMGQKELKEMGVTFCQLPYQLHRIIGD